MRTPRSAARSRVTALLSGAAVAVLLAFPGAASAAVTSSVAAGILTVSSDAADGIAIACVGGNVKVNGADPTTGGPAACTGIDTIDVTGGPGDNVITLVGVTVVSTGAVFPNVTAVDVDGGGGNDTITGSDIDDDLFGGAGNDRIIGDNNPAGTRDNSQGGPGDDTLVWNPGDGDDVNEGGDGTDTIEVNGGGGGEQFTVKPSTTAGRIAFDRTGPTPPGPFNLDIGTSERLDLNANGGDDTMTSDTAVGFALDIDGGDGNDTLDGGDGPDLITGGAGNDRIIGDNNPAGTRDNSQGGAGDDTLVWNPGDGDDTNEGGDGTDTIEVNGGGGGEQFTVKPSTTAGRVAFDRTGPTPPGPFNLDIGTSEKLVLNAGGGDDRITGAKGLAGLIASTFNGDAGNDRITGTDGADRLSGGEGSDVIRSRDTKGDRVDCGPGFDLARVDRKDHVRKCDIVIGGRLRVRLIGKTALVTGGRAALRLRCVGTKRCSGIVRIRRGGKTLGSARFKATSKRAKKVRVKLSKRGRRLVARAPQKGLKVEVQINARDSAGNGWRTTPHIRLKR